MDNLSENRGRSGGRRAVIALTSCAFGAVLILLASQIGSKSVRPNRHHGRRVLCKGPEKENPARMEHCSG